MSGPRIARRWLALLALASAAFTLIGSLVPFEFRSLTWGDATSAFTWAMTERLRIESKSDALVNVMLGVPLGFALLGVYCVGRSVPRSRSVVLGLALLPACAVFSATVEFLQLYTPSRMCSGFDVLAQTIGAALGLAGWLACGPWLTEEVRKAATGTGSASRFLVAYVLLLGFIQALPLDFSASPADAYRKFRDGGVKPVPFREFATLSGDEVLGRIAGLLKLAGLYLPVGLLAARVPGRFWERENAGRVALAALGLVLTIELAQVLVKSRTCSGTDTLTGATAVLTGWWLGTRSQRGLNFPATLALGGVWWSALVWVSWQPFDAVPDHSLAFDWVPGAPLEGRNPLLALEEMLTKLVLFGLCGAVVSAADTGSSRRRGRPAACVLGLFAAAFFEVGQTRFLGHTPCVTDVLLGGLGAFCGAWVTERVRTHGERRGVSPPRR